MPNLIDDDPTATLRERVQSLRLPSATNDPTRGGGGGRVWLPWALVLLLAACTASLAGRVYTGQVPVATAAAENAPVAAASAAKPAAAPATAETPKPAAAPGATALEAKGYIIPAHQIQVSPIEVAGLVKELFIEEGKRVAKGEVLAVLDRTSFNADVLDAKATLAGTQARLLELERGYRKEEKEQATAEYNESLEMLNNARLNLKRAVELRGTGLSAQEYDTAQSTFKSMEQRVQRLKAAMEMMELGPRVEKIAAAKAEVAAATARLQKAEWRLDNCTIRAPLAGTILKKSAEVGNLVNPLAFAASSGSLCELADLSDLEVELDITERDVSKVAKGMRCTIRAEAYPARVYEGVVDRLMPIANRAKGAVPVRVKVTVPKGEEGVYLKPEMGAVVSFLEPGK